MNSCRKATRKSLLEATVSEEELQIEIDSYDVYAIRYKLLKYKCEQHTGDIRYDTTSTMSREESIQSGIISMRTFFFFLGVI